MSKDILSAIFHDDVPKLPPTVVEIGGTIDASGVAVGVDVDADTD